VAHPWSYCKIMNNNAIQRYRLPTRGLLLGFVAYI
jgi:hypothetical protein